MLKWCMNSKKGQALVEFALVIPLLLVFFFGIIEFGRIFGAELVLDYSAREGVRTGVTGGNDETILAQVNTSAFNLDTTKLTVVIDPLEESRTRGQQLSVRVSYPVTVVFPFISNIIGETVNVNSTCVMRVE